MAQILPKLDGFYTEIEPLDTKVPLNETNLTFITYDKHDNKSLKLTVPSSVWLEQDGYTKNTYRSNTTCTIPSDKKQFRLFAKHIGDLRLPIYEI